MNVPMWFVLVLLLIVSGCIAYAGDIIGKTLGRKRLSFLGLRPKQTAHLCSIGSGVSILLLSLGLILGVSRNARDAVFKLEEIKAKQLSAQKQANLLHIKNQREERKNRELAKRTSELRSERDASLQLTKQADAARQVAESEQKRAETERKSAYDALAIVKQDLQKAQTRLKLARKELQKTQNDYTIALRQRDALGPQILEFERKQLALKNEIKQLETSVSRLRSQAAELQGALIEVLSAPVVYSPGQIIASRLIRVAGRKSEEILDDLENLLDYSSGQAVKRGASNEGEGRAVVIAPRLDLEGHPMIEKEQLDRTATDLSRYDGKGLDGYDGRFIIDIIARGNCIKGYKADAEISVHPNQMVFRRNDEISQLVVEGGDSPARIFSRLQELIEQGRQIAEQHHLRPRQDSVYHPATSEKVFDCISRVQEAKGPVYVRLIADGEIRSSDYLNVRFETAPASAASR